MNSTLRITVPVTLQGASAESTAKVTGYLTGSDGLVSVPSDSLFSRDIPSIALKTFFRWFTARQRKQKPDTDFARCTPASVFTLDLFLPVFSVPERGKHGLNRGQGTTFFLSMALARHCFASTCSQYADGTCHVVLAVGLGRTLADCRPGPLIVAPCSSSALVQWTVQIQVDTKW